MDGKRKQAQRRADGWRGWPEKFILILALLWKYARRIPAQLGHLFRRTADAAAAVPYLAGTAARTRRSSRFPESKYGIMQMALFLWNLGPTLGSLLGERLLRRRRRSAQGSGRTRDRLEAIQLHPAVFLGGAMAVAAVAVIISLYTVGTAVSYGGTELGAVADRQTAERAADALETVTRRALDNQGYTLDRSLLTTGRKLVARKALASEEELRQRLTDCVGLIDYGYVLYVGGEPIGATAFPGALEELLEQIKLSYVTENTVECRFEEDIEVRQEYVDRQFMMNLGHIAQKLTEDKIPEVTYTVVDGDTYYDIAGAYDLTVSRLLSMNPGYQVDMLHTGDVLTVAQAEPYLTVVDVERQSYVQDVPFSTEYQDTERLYQGDYEVLTEGAYGKEDVTANVTYVNGEERGRQIVARATLVEPVTEVRARGITERPFWLATGEFRWPCTGVLSSRYGYRPIPIAGASPFHKGIDIANSYGTPIYASDGGTVEYAGWRSGYGYLVIIDHDNGFKTYYGHNRALLVSTGEHVYPGQQIARMGSTGLSTGPHCHFGIMLNGTFVNPLNYLKS